MEFIEIEISDFVKLTRKQWETVENMEAVSCA